MPYKYETQKEKIPRELDKRIKLTPEQRQEIKEQYTHKSQRQLAKEYQVSRRLIQFIGDPKKKQKDLLRREERGGSKKYYDKEKQREYIKKHRRRKQELKLKGELIKWYVNVEKKWK